MQSAVIPVVMMWSVKEQLCTSREILARETRSSQITKFRSSQIITNTKYTGTTLDPSPDPMSRKVRSGILPVRGFRMDKIVRYTFMMQTMQL